MSNEVDLTSDQTIFVRALREVGKQLVGKDFEKYQKEPIEAEDLRDLIQNEILARQKKSIYYFKRLKSYKEKIEQLLESAIPDGEYPHIWLEESNIVISGDGTAYCISSEQLNDSKWVVRIDFDCNQFGVVSELLEESGKVIVFDTEEAALMAAKASIERLDS
ncbi:MAG: hypothetical protein NXI29_26475 [bacterium]|nr:hypothetical protein [bacterium]